MKNNNRINKLVKYFDNLPFSFKTSFLLFIISGGMIIIIFLSQISIYTLKNDFDILFEKRTKPIIQLENIKDTLCYYLIFDFPICKNISYLNNHAMIFIIF